MASRVTYTEAERRATRQALELSRRLAQEAARPRQKTVNNDKGHTMAFKPTYETLTLAQRVSDGDIVALPLLWATMFEEPFDPTRPIEDIGRDISEKIEAYNAAQAAEAAEAAAAKAKKTPVEEWDEALTLLADVTQKIFNTIGAPRK